MPEQKFETTTQEEVSSFVSVIETTGTATQTSGTSPSVEERMEQLQQAARRRKQKFDIANAASLVSVFSALSFFYLLTQNMLNTSWSMLSLSLQEGIIMTWILSTGITFGYYKQGNTELKAGAEALTSTTDMRIIGPLTEALRFYERNIAFATLGTDYQVYKIAIATLTQLLPFVREEDTNLLNDYQRRCLYKAMEEATEGNRKRYNEEFLLAGLLALEKIGDAEALTLVRSIANMRTGNPSRSRVREAAQRILPVLQQRVLLQQSPQTLLRASDAVAATPDVLLRPASAAGETAPHELLRSGDAPADTPTE